MHSLHYVRGIQVMSLIKQHLHKELEGTFILELSWSDVEYLLSYLDEDEQGSRANQIREDIFQQVYE